MFTKKLGFIFFIAMVFLTTNSIAQQTISVHKRLTIQTRASLNTLVLDVKDGSVADGTPVIQWSYLYGENQQFVLVPSNEAYYYYIKNVKSGKYLDVFNSSLDNGAAIIQYTPLNSDNQKFKFIESGVKGYYYIKAKHSSKYLDIKDASAKQGGELIQYTFLGTDNQKFRLAHAPRTYAVK